METLFLIPARAGSKGLPGKNIKKLNGKPLILYSIDFARKFVPDDSICVSTDGENIKKVIESYNLKVPFLRPNFLSNDEATSLDTIKHAIEFYYKKGICPKKIVLLQPTSPFRLILDLKLMLESWNENFDMMVSVKISHENPYFTIFEEDEYGFLRKSKDSLIMRRQDAPYTYTFNGSIYIYNVNSLLSKKSTNDYKIKKYVMNDPVLSIDIDTSFDWLLAETVLKNNLFKINK